MSKVDFQKKYYFPKRLQRELSEISRHPLTIVEAPSGFGKTTAVREYLKGKVQEGACEHWYTSFGESVFYAWQGICELFANISDDVAGELLELKQPSLDTLFRMSTCLKEIRCERETYLVVDNYQLMDFDIPFELLYALSTHGDPKLHIIFITQQLKARHGLLMHNDNVHAIDAQVFFFDRQDTKKLFALEGIRLSEEESEHVYTHTEGWVSAIRLQIINYLESKSVASDVGMEQLVEQAVWNRFTDAEKDFFVAISVFDSFTASQAACVIGEEVLPTDFTALLLDNDFIKQHPDKNRFSMHTILKNYLQTVLRYRTKQADREQILKRAGDACAAEGDIHFAAQFYNEINDYDSLLSLPFTREFFADQREKNGLKLYKDVVDRCSPSTLSRYPKALIQFGYMSLDSGFVPMYRRISHLLDSSGYPYGKDNALSINQLNGHVALLRSSGAYNDLTKMAACETEAWDAFGHDIPDSITLSPFLFGAVSFVSALWRESASLDRTMDLFDDMRSARLSAGIAAGAGSTYALRAEVALLRGEHEQAEILYHKAVSDAEAGSEAAAIISAELTLARVALLRGDVQLFMQALGRLQAHAKSAANRTIFRMAEQSIAVIGTILRIKEFVPAWVADMNHMRRIVNYPELSSTTLLHLKWLSMEKRTSECIGACSLVIEDFERRDVKTKHILPYVCSLLCLADVQYASGQTSAAHELMHSALKAALPDRIYLPFASCTYGEELIKEVGLAGVVFSGEPERVFANLLDLCQMQRAGAESISRALFKQKTPLTPREMEIALLAQQRFSAKEIGERLYISDMTVRAMLRSVYKKLGVHSRTELSEISL